MDVCTHKFCNVNCSFCNPLVEGREVHGFVVDVFGTDTEDNFLADIALKFGVACLFCGKLEFVAAEASVKAVALLLDAGIDEVHLRCADKSCNEEVNRLVVKLLRRINLLDDTVLHNNDTGSHGHSFDLVMCNVDEGCAESLVKLCKLGSHGSTELSIEVGKRFVEKEYLRLTDDSTTESNSLTLTTGQSLGLSVEEVLDVKDTSCFFNSSLDFFLGSLAELKTECHVFKHGHVRIKSVVLEHHGDVSVLRSYVVYESFADVEFAFCDFFKTRDHTESGGLTTTGRTNEDDKFLVLDFETEVGYGGNAAGVSLVDML